MPLHHHDVIPNIKSSASPPPPPYILTCTHLYIDIIKMYNPNVRGFATKYTIPFTGIGRSNAKNDVAVTGAVAKYAIREFYAKI